MIDLSKQGNVYVLRMQEGENRFNRKFVDAFNDALDEAERSSGPAALVTIGEGKYYSNGLDLQWLTSEGAREAKTFVEEVHQIFGRILSFPLVTVAAVNGHAFAGGAMLAVAHDFQVMRSDRGYFCIPEIDLKLALTPAMNALLQARLPRVVFHEAVITGKRFGAEEAKAKGIVTEVASEDSILAKAIALAEPLASKDRRTMGTHKRQMYAAALEVLNAAKK